MSTHCSTGLPTPSTDNIKEQIKAISVEMAILGFHGALFLMSAYLLVQKGLRTSLARRWLLLMTTLMFTISIASVVCATDFYVRSIDNYSLDDLPVDRALMLRESLTSNFGLRINLLLSDIIVVWRAWVLWPASLWARLIMAVALLGSIGGVIVSSILLFLAKLTDVAFLDWLNTSPILTVPLFFTNIVACVMVGIKVWDYRQNVKAYIGNAGNHGASIERTLLLILESGVVYCLLWLFLLLSGVEVLSDDSNTVLLSVAVSVAGLYPTIIIILVALEKSHTDTVFHPSTTPTESHSLDPLAFMASAPKDTFMTVGAALSPFVMTPILILQDIAVCILLYVLHLRLKRASSHPPLPPGPPAEWLLGHLRVVPQEDAARAYYRWSKEYGSAVVHVNVLGQPIVVLNTLTAAVELLHKQGAIYSNRPHWESFRMLGYEHDVLLTSSKAPSFPILRGALQNYLAKSTIHQFAPDQVREARKLVKRIVKDPEGCKGALQMFSTSVIIAIITGHEINTPDDDYLQIGRGICEAMSGGGPPGATGVDLFPFLRHLPNWCDPTGSTAHVRKNKPAIMRMINVPYERVTQEILAQLDRPSYFLQSKKRRQSMDSWMSRRQCGFEA
ncbi:cytochrome P450 [Schizophyllum commune Loenen D]|nr:cytochrome P450 [Schizophyllum commune Loenen D]